jgi:hypothetical protein
MRQGHETAHHYFPQDIAYAALFRAMIYISYRSLIKFVTANFVKIVISFFGTPASVVG